MALRMNLGRYYRIVFPDDSSMQFRFLGTDASGKPVIQTPPDSGERKVLTRTDCKDFYEIDAPIEELVTVSV